MHPEITITFRPPTKQDGAAVWELIRRAGTLDLNSSYCYLMLCDLFQDTCVVAEANGKVAGFASAFFRPGRHSTLFVWQIAVDPENRGQGLGTRMLSELLERHGPERIRYMEATVSPSNEASRRLFRSFANANRCRFNVYENEGYPASIFPEGKTHEAEPLLRIGPFQ